MFKALGVPRFFHCFDLTDSLSIFYKRHITTKPKSNEPKKFEFFTQKRKADFP